MQTDISFDTFLFRNIFNFLVSKSHAINVRTWWEENASTDAVITIIDDAKFLQNWSYSDLFWLLASKKCFLECQWLNICFQTYQRIILIVSQILSPNSTPPRFFCDCDSTAEYPK